MSLRLEVDEQGVTLTFKSRKSLLDRLITTRKAPQIETELQLDFALADLRAAAAEAREEVEIHSSRIRIQHKTVSMLSAEAAAALGLPPLIDLTLRTDVAGTLGSPDFRLHYEWLRAGRRELTQRVGAILQTSGKHADGLRRLPRWIFDALNVADQFDGRSSLSEHWAALATFRRAVDPGIRMDSDDPQARVALSDFLDGLEVKLVDRFSISPKDDDQFDIIPFSSDGIDDTVIAGEPVSEVLSELEGAALRVFQGRVYTRGARPAYMLSPQKYLVVDPGAEAALRIMAEIKRSGDHARRSAFIRNPRQAITEAYTEQLRQSGKLEGLSSAGEEEMIESVAGPVFIETMEYSSRVTGVKVYQAPILGFRGSKTTWLPEEFTPALVQAIERLSADELKSLITDMDKAEQIGSTSIELDGESIAVTPSAREVLSERLALVETAMSTDFEKEKPPKCKGDEGGPIILDHKSNLEHEVGFFASIEPRLSKAEFLLPTVIRTDLKDHQAECFQWMLDAWKAGLPGILNADEQGLGKTLQAIAFLAWVKEHGSRNSPQRTGPVLIVAPTSLLENWENEVDKHLAAPGLGNVVRLYGSGIGSRKPPGSPGYDTQSGNAVLDFRDIEEAISEGRGHRYWILTTYTTLTNYQHSLGKIPFSTAVFDEIQALKNPGSLRAFAAAAINADFRIGLTGTPIENSVVDLWAIMDQLSPGWLDSLKNYRDRYDSESPENLQELYELVFSSQYGRPPFGLRRLKEDVAKDLPPKNRRIHPRLMPKQQSDEYERARMKLASGTRGSALKMLHHIRSVSVHPAAGASVSDQEYVSMSGRLKAAMDVLRRLYHKRERVLVFIEHRQMQYRFIELVKREFGISDVELINGDTPIAHRQKIVDRFQEHLTADAGFDILVLSPKAAGVGLTLTAATHVIHLSRWWNPAVEEQCNDRIHRIGQNRPVTVHVPMAIHPDYQHKSFDCLLHSLMNEKRRLARSALWPMGDTGSDAEQLQKMLSDDEKLEGNNPVVNAMANMFARDGLPLPPFDSDGSLPYS